MATEIHRGYSTPMVATVMVPANAVFLASTLITAGHRRRSRGGVVQVVELAFTVG